MILILKIQTMSQRLFMSVNLSRQFKKKVQFPEVCSSSQHEAEN